VSLSSLVPLPHHFYVLILSHISTIHQMVNTRNQHASANNKNNAPNTPPPPTLEQLLLMQAQMLQTMQQTMANMHQGQGHQQAPQPHPHASLARIRGPSHQHFHTLLIQWMPMSGLKPLKRIYESCNAITERWLLTFLM
jgi:hypothetical protein